MAVAYTTRPEPSGPFVEAREQAAGIEHDLRSGDALGASLSRLGGALGTLPIFGGLSILAIRRSGRFDCAHFTVLTKGSSGRRVSRQSFPGRLVALDATSARSFIGAAQSGQRLFDGCRSFVDWFAVADNPAFVFETTACPSELTTASGLTAQRASGHSRAGQRAGRAVLRVTAPGRLSGRRTDHRPAPLGSWRGAVGR